MVLRQNGDKRLPLVQWKEIKYLNDLIIIFCSWRHNLVSTLTPEVTQFVSPTLIQHIYLQVSSYSHLSFDVYSAVIVFSDKRKEKWVCPLLRKHKVNQTEPLFLLNIQVFCTKCLKISGKESEKVKYWIIFGSTLILRFHWNGLSYDTL